MALVSGFLIFAAPVPPEPCLQLGGRDDHATTLSACVVGGSSFSSSLSRLLRPPLWREMAASEKNSVWIFGTCSVGATLGCCEAMWGMSDCGASSTVVLEHSWYFGRYLRAVVLCSDLQLSLSENGRFISFPWVKYTLLLFAKKLAREKNTATIAENKEWWVSLWKQNIKRWFLL